MEYKRLDFGQYFIDTSKDWTKTGKARFPMKYKNVTFSYKLLGFIPVKCSADWECHYEKDRDVIQVNFEQSRGFFDWVINILFSEKAYDEFIWHNPEKDKDEQIQLKASKGWMKMYQAMKKPVKTAIKKELAKHPDAEIEIVGWSLGSGQAQFAEQDVFWSLDKQPYVYTFGSVKPWRGGKKVRNYLKHTYKVCYNFIHKNDIVTYMPCFFGFFAMNPIKLGRFNFFKLFNPHKWHTIYYDNDLYRIFK